MKNTLFYLQHYLSPSMTFIYRQLLGVSKEFNTHVLCSRIFENSNVFPFNNLNFFPQNKIITGYYRVKEIVLRQPYFGFININPKLIYYRRKQYEKFIKNNNYKIIHAHFGPSGIEVMPLASKLNLPLLVSFHGFDASSLLKFEKYIDNLKKLFKGNSYIITPSEQMLNSFHKNGLYCRNEFVIHYGIPLNFYSYKEREPIIEKVSKNKEIIFLQVSNFVEKKGHKYTIQTFNSFVKKYPNAKLILAGDGPLKKSMITLTKEYNLSEKIVFPGLVYQDEVKKLMYSADVFVHHSITSNTGEKEGIPNAIMEAMATGLPIISTDHSAIPELIDNETNGFLVPEKDIKAYEYAMDKILEIDDSLGRNGRKKIENDFNMEIENSKLISIYRNILH